MTAVKGGSGFPYRIFDHKSDIGFDVYGRTRKELFCNAAIALLHAITEASAVAEREERALSITGVDWADLWISYLRELLYMANGEGFLVRTVDIRHLTGRNLSLTVIGEPYDPARHEILTEIKAVTYHQARIQKTAAGWRGRFIVDV